MGEQAKVLVEIVFNICYLIVIWALVLAMIKRRAMVARTQLGEALCLLLAFAFLALGDTGHVGFRVIAYVLGGLETSIVVFGSQMNLAALGSLSTAWTFTLFYVFMIIMWKARYDRKLGLIGWLALGAAIVRSLIMLLPANEWTSLTPPRDIYLARNIPLIFMQLCAAFLILRDAKAANDSTFTWIAVMILVSFVCYIPVVALVHSVPSIGMLMIPKTLAYLAIAVIGFKSLFPARRAAEAPGLSA